MENEGEWTETDREWRCHVPYFLEPSLSFSGLPVTFPPVPDHFHVFYNYSHPFRFSPLSWFVPLSVPSLFFRLFPSTSLFQLVSFQFSILGSCHVPYFLEPSLSFSSLPVTFPPVPDHFRVSYDYSNPFCFSPLSLICSVIRPFRVFPPISVYLFVSTRFLSVFLIRIRP